MKCCFSKFAVTGGIFGRIMSVPSFEETSGFITKDVERSGHTYVDTTCLLGLKITTINIRRDSKRVPMNQVFRLDGLKGTAR
jgi:hypothetical protein